MNKKKFAILALSVALTSTAIALVSSREEVAAKRNIASHLPTPGAVSLPRVDEPELAPDNRVRRESLSSHLRGPFQTLGDRLEKRGKERVSVAGALRWAGGEQATPFVMIWETPGRLRLEVNSGGQQQITIFDGARVLRTVGNIDGRDEDLLETLVYDSAEHFFVSQMQGAATRFLGTRFRLIEDSRAEYSGPVYDIFEVTEPITSRREVREQTRQYLFNSDTQLLEAVKYVVMANGQETRVELRLENWRSVNGQRFPGQVVRLENDARVLTLNLNLASIAVGPGAQDGIFTLVGGR
ncbi:MAG: hypothetical protein ND895_24385 [Pyrinomonadaceae bacterium]|nr:hypothetical protein [Pyrinomonadaceae bacterium]